MGDKTNSSAISWGPFSLGGKVALVTGGATGIGLGITCALTDAGARVIAIARRADGQARIDAVVPGVIVFNGDLSDANASANLFAVAYMSTGVLTYSSIMPPPSSRVRRWMSIPHLSMRHTLSTFERRIFFAASLRRPAADNDCGEK